MIVATRGYGTGSSAASIPEVVLRGYFPSEEPPPVEYAVGSFGIEYAQRKVRKKPREEVKRAVLEVADRLVDEQFPFEPVTLEAFQPEPFMLIDPRAFMPSPEQVDRQDEEDMLAMLEQLVKMREI